MCTFPDFRSYPTSCNGLSAQSLLDGRRAFKGIQLSSAIQSLISLPFPTPLLGSWKQQAVLQACNPRSLHCWAQSQICLFWQRSDKVSKCREFFLLLSCLDFLKIFIYLIYFWLCWVFTALHWFSLDAESRGDASLWFAGLSLLWLLLLWSTSPRAWGLSSCRS